MKQIYYKVKITNPAVIITCGGFIVNTNRALNSLHLVVFGNTDSSVSVVKEDSAKLRLPK